MPETFFISQIRTDLSPEATRSNYLAEYTAGSVIRNSFKIYFRHFGILWSTYVVPAVLPMIMQEKAQMEGSAFFFPLMLLNATVGLFAYAAITIAVSDICVGNAPSFKRSYSKVFGNIFAKLLATNLLAILAVTVGLLLLVIPGLVFCLWLMLAPPVVMLEGKSPIAAFKRSKQLGYGSLWRNFAVVLLMQIIVFVFGGVLGAGLGFVGILSGMPLVGAGVGSVAMVSLFPLFLISLVLLYYDARVRKEGYDAKSLAEDLAR